MRLTSLWYFDMAFLLLWHSARFPNSIYQSSLKWKFPVLFSFLLLLLLQKFLSLFPLTLNIASKSQLFAMAAISHVCVVRWKKIFVRKYFGRVSEEADVKCWKFKKFVTRQLDWTTSHLTSTYLNLKPNSPLAPCQLLNRGARICLRFKIYFKREME